MTQKERELSAFIKEVLEVTKGGDVSDDAAFKEYLNESGYEHVRKLDDGTWVGLTPLIFTVALCMGLDRFGYQKRYCYDDRELAIAEIHKLKSGDRIPAGWIAKRPQD